MATMRVIGDELHVRFSVPERLAVWRSGVVVPLASVRRVDDLDDAVHHTRGGRIGFLISGVVKVGIWGLGTDTRQLVSVRRDVRALRITLDRAAAGIPFDELLISTRDADSLAAEIGA